MKLFFKILLLPLAIIYGSIIWLRNWLYKSNFIGSTDFEIPVISVGNLSVGGTGKTPFVELLIELLQPNYKIGVLSRGYKRKTTGYVAVKHAHTSKEVGDEPLMIRLKYPDVQVSVGEQRVFAIPRLLSEHPETQVILLDDAFQHQSVRPDINILLTTYDNPFWKDHILPIGTLREFESGKKRANIIVITKCPQTFNESDERKIIGSIHPDGTQKVFFSELKYGTAYNLLDPNDHLIFSKEHAELLITGIANADHLENYIEERSKEIVHFNFDDHHFFEEDELENILKNYPAFKRWITTEKDGVRLALHKNWFIKNNISLYCLPVKTKLTGSNKDEFAKTISGYLEYFYTEEIPN
ncbi:MAG: lpxK [Bacteroidota bacterium]|nr:lpxK [Bacteroidota bacterium]